MIANIKHTILGYNKNEFMPIYRDGVIDNTDEFVKYKIKSALVPIGNKLNDMVVRSWEVN